MPKKKRNFRPISYSMPRLDLHGKTAEEVIDCLDPFLLAHKDREQVAIISGKGKGVVKKKVLEYLKQAGYSWRYEKIQGLNNEGCVIVDME